MFPQLFDSVPDALIVVDGDGTIVRANPQAERLFGYPAKALEGLAVEHLMAQGVRERHRTHRRDYMLNPRIRPMGDTGQALTGQRLDGQQFPVEIALSPIEYQAGTHYLASIRDISETQRARQALVRARYDTLVARIGQLALEAADDASVIEAVPELLAHALDVETVAIAFLHSARDGLEVRSSVGLDEAWADRAGAIGPALEASLGRGTPRVVDDVGDGHGEPATPAWPLSPGNRSGAVVPLLDRDRPMGVLVAQSSRPRRFDHDALHLLQSVANLLAALVQRRRTEDQLAHSQRLDAIGQLTGGIAHDFNNLLTVVSGSLQLLEDAHPQQPDAAELIAGALRSVARGAELTGKLLAFARRQRLDPSPIDVASLLQDLGLMLGRTLGDLIRIEMLCEPGIPRAFADAMQLDTALVNLALNARDAMPRGGELLVAASERWVTHEDARPEPAPGHYVVFSVTDTGLGMTEETRGHAFEPFFTTKDVGRGSGLGLSMVYGFVRQSGGYLQIESRLGYGTRVDLYLPVAHASAMAPAPRIGLPSSSGHGETVLVVEDDPAVRDISSAFLRSLGYRVHAVADADEALLQLHFDDRIALLFSDVMLGAGGDGAGLARAARRLRPGLPVLLTSGYEDSPVSAVDGPDDHIELLRKPYRREQLAAAVRRTLSSASAGANAG